MSSLLIQSLPTILILTAIVSITDFISYCTFRLIEEKYRRHSFSLIPFLLLAYMIADNGRVPSILLNPYNYLLVILFSTLAAIIHRKTNSASSSLLVTFVIIFLTSLASLPISVYLTSALTAFGYATPQIVDVVSLRYILHSNQLAESSFILCINAQLIVPPILFWVWKKFRLRPGMDKHLES